MSLRNILAPGHALYGVQGASKKRTLEYIANIISQRQPGLDAKELFNQLVTREKFGSTGLGNGFALPHCRVANCEEPQAVFLRLAKPIDFDAIDKKPVDLVFALVVPEHETERHLDFLRQIAEQFSNDSLCEQLREADSSETLYRLLTAKVTA
ncbi:PTS IIA-like nitrogen regulatory protein PtsN [Parendozoicomonas sp. Alg238-R29]|uniref:PTS IIA-like nitrogen regulatory protein PtsN n=1 Tax=Parendozoicomonas sp. Alg238-R29 TaxID=2993446 RepID=UPI00248EF7C4|nr:PTS IIA-like nitrogen regulatory protein PtsN [Parendozoicomonas sp. Alg238-R29]